MTDNDADQDPQHTGDEFDIAFVTTTVADAELLVGRLEAEGIEAFLHSNDGGGLFPNFDTLDGVAVVVRTADLARAKDLLGAIEPLGEDEEPPAAGSPG